MKKHLFKVLTAFALVICSTFALTGCFGGEAKVTAIDLTQTFKTQYEIGETLDVSNGIIKVTYDDDTQKDLFVTNSMVAGFNTQTVGQKTMIITYKDSTKTVPYTVTGPSFKEDRYLWYNPTLSTGNCIYIYKQGGAYIFAQYSVSNSNAAAEWMKLQNSAYLEDVTGIVTMTMTVTLNESDYYYYMSGTIDTFTVSFKIYSLDNMVRIDAPGVNALDGFVRFISAA